MEAQQGNFADTLRFLGRGSLMAIAVALVCGFAAYAVSLRLPTTYNATSTVFTTNNPPNDHNLGMAFYRIAPLDADGYGFAATSRDVLNGALELLDMSPIHPSDLDRLAKQIRIGTDATNNAMFIHITATAPTAQGAADIANAVAKSLIRWDNDRSRAGLDRVASTIEAQLQALVQENASLAERSDAESVRALSENVAIRVQRNNDLTMLRVLSQQNTGALASFERASPALTSSGPRPILNTVVAAALGLVFGYAAVGLFEALRRERRHLNRTARSEPRF